jgi:competence protein ComFC
MISLNKTITWLGDCLKTIIAPPFCAYCKTFLRERTVLCATCTAHVRPIVSHELVITGRYSVQVFAISDYKDPIRSLVLAKGYHHLVAARQLGILLWQMTDLKNQQFDYMVPVPLHWWRYAQRSYNQAAEIAYGFRTQTGIPILHALKRRRSTVRQSLLSHDARAANVQEAFLLRRGMRAQLSGKRILLIDDLMTTGATLHACVQEIRTAGPLHIVVGVASRVV